MAGFYIHIPFCRQACRYCDFYFTVALKYRDDLVKAMTREIELRASEFSRYEFETLYFGGGTPSVLTVDELQTITSAVFKHYRFTERPEFTLEANPDDISTGYLEGLKNLGVNRLSMGVQSFYERDLKLMRRSHTSNQAEKAVQLAQDAGLHNMNVDLIYGIPGASTSEFETNLQKILDFNVPHISAYHLTYEPGTVFDHWRKKGRLNPVEEEDSFNQFSVLKKMAAEQNFLHYEISNFAREGFFSRHNLNYWKQVPYIGIGPSAHSYSENSRRWNISNLKQYIANILVSDGKYYEKENLSTEDLYNEYILTSLRTMWGLDLSYIKQRFGDNYVKYTLETAQKFLESDMVEKNGDKMKLSNKGIFTADYIMREFFRVE